MNVWFHQPALRGSDFTGAGGGLISRISYSAALLTSLQYANDVFGITKFETSATNVQPYTEEFNYVDIHGFNIHM